MPVCRIIGLILGPCPLGYAATDLALGALRRPSTRVQDVLDWPFHLNSKVTQLSMHYDKAADPGFSVWPGG